MKTHKGIEVKVPGRPVEVLYRIRANRLNQEWALAP
jgi:hypothetical protein